MSDRQITVIQPRPVTRTVVQAPQLQTTVVATPSRATTVVTAPTRQETVITAPVRAQTVIQVGQGPSGPSGAAGAPTFETISQNIQALAKTLVYASGVLVQMVYDLGGGQTIVKTFGYVLGVLTTITLSGSVPSGVDLTKTLHYTSGDLTGVTYA